MQYDPSIDFETFEERPYHKLGRECSEYVNIVMGEYCPDEIRRKCDQAIFTAFHNGMNDLSDFKKLIDDFVATNLVEINKIQDAQRAIGFL